LTFLVNQSSAVASAILPEWQYVTLGMSPQAISFSFAYIAAVTIVAQAWGVGPLVKRYGEERVTQVGVVIYTMALVSLSSSGSLISFFFAMTLLAFGLGIFTPVLNSLISKLAEDHERGAVMGIQQSAAAFSRVTGPLFAWYVYAQFKGSSAFIAATISVVPALIMAFWVAGRSAAARQKVKT
jgi:MFS family permease